MLLNKPAAGDTDWTTEINDNWTAIEGAIDQAICQGRLTLSSGNPVYGPQTKTPSSTSTGSDTVDFSTPHGWTTGTMVTPSATGGGLTAGTTYYINAVDSDTVSFHTTLANAEAGTPKVDLTASITAQIQPYGVARSTVYFTPSKGDRITLYDGSTWNAHAFTERSLALSGLVANVTYDVFIYNNAGTLTLETLAWKKVTATNNPTAGSNKVISVPDTTGVTVGSLVTVKDGSNNEVARVNAVSANTSITVDSLATGFTAPDVYYPSRETNLSTQNGILVKSGAATRRFVGMIRATSATSTEDSTSKRFVINYYNRVALKIKRSEATASWGWTSTAWTPWRNQTINRIEILANGEDDVYLDFTCTATVVYQSNVGVGEDKTNGNDAEILTSPQTAGLVVTVLRAIYTKNPTEGYHYLQLMERSGSSGNTFYGTTAPGDVLSGALGWIKG